jgi:hypothetical protein
LKVLEIRSTLTALRTKVVSHVLEAYKVYIGSCCRNFKNGSFDWELKLPFLIVESKWRVISPLSRPPFPKKHSIKD